MGKKENPPQVQKMFNLVRGEYPRAYTGDTQQKTNKQKTTTTKSWSLIFSFCVVQRFLNTGITRSVLSRSRTVLFPANVFKIESKDSKWRMCIHSTSCRDKGSCSIYSINSSSNWLVDAQGRKILESPHPPPPPQLTPVFKTPRRKLYWVTSFDALAVLPSTIFTDHRVWLTLNLSISSTGLRPLMSFEYYHAQYSLTTEFASL